MILKTATAEPAMKFLVYIDELRYNFEYTLPEGVSEKIKTSEKIIFSRTANFTTKYNVHDSASIFSTKCPRDYEKTFYVLPPYYGETYPIEQNLDITYSCHHSGLKKGEIAGIAIGCLLFIAAIVIIRKRRQKANSSENQDAKVDKV